LTKKQENEGGQEAVSYGYAPTHTRQRFSPPIGKQPEGTYARIFRKEIEWIDNLPEGEYKSGLSTENIISVYSCRGFI
jgi:hypothetical protein